MKLIEYHNINGKLELLSGLHIGTSMESIVVGDLDNPTVKQGNIPYIPGSSLKGKLRNIMEITLDKIDKKGGIHVFDPETCLNPPCPVCSIFGSVFSGNAIMPYPSRLIVRDCLIDMDHPFNKELYENTKGLPFSEEKSEIIVNRISQSGSQSGIRKIECVPAGTVFNIELVFKEFEGDKDLKFLNLIIKTLKLLEKDYLGGNGTRGYGRVKIDSLYVGKKKVI